MNTTKIYKISMILLISIIMFTIGQYSIDNTQIIKESYNKGYLDAWTNATELIDSSNFILKPSMEIYSISGDIKNISISKNSFIIEANPISMNPLSEDSKKTIRTVKITPETNLVKYITKSEDEIQNMIATNNFNELMLDSKENITLDQLNVGDQISIISNYNIKHELEFIATTITVQ